MQTISYRAGTCLLTAQQAMVDISSNFRTSLSMFSSVNLLFLVAMVQWISASFSLFSFGQHTIETVQKVAAGATPASAASCMDPIYRFWNAVDSSDVVVGICTVWNLFPVIFMITDFVYNKYVPVNNLVLAILFILAATW